MSSRTRMLLSTHLQPVIEDPAVQVHPMDVVSEIRFNIHRVPWCTSTGINRNVQKEILKTLDYILTEEWKHQVELEKVETLSPILIEYCFTLVSTEIFPLGTKHDFIYCILKEAVIYAIAGLQTLCVSVAIHRIRTY